MPGFELIGQEEFAEVRDVFENGGVLFRNAFEAKRNGVYKVRDFEKAFSEKFNSRHALAVTSGTAALRVALAALQIGPGDEVITQSFTFVATVEAIIESGATPVCAEVDETLNLDPNSLQQLITPKTKAVIAVHMLGVPARLEQISEICKANNIFLIEDTAWGCGGNLHGVPLGTWGDIGTFSFDFAKTMTTGEGGMILFRDPEVYQRAAAWHDHGHENNPTVPRWEDTRSSSGFNFRMMELQGAVGIAQLRKLDFVVEQQRKNMLSIWENIKDIDGITLREKPEGSHETADALVFFVPSKEIALRCREELLENGISTKILPEAFTWHFAGTWDHMPELVRKHGNLDLSFNASRQLLSRSVSLPVTVEMAENLPGLTREALLRALSYDVAL